MRGRNNTEAGQRAPDPGRETRAGDRGPLPTFDVAELVSDRGEAVLVHGAERYRLRITARGKLILTK